MSIYDIFVSDLEGNDVKIETFRGKCLLIVNIASDCKLVKNNISNLRALKKKFSDGLSHGTTIDNQIKAEFDDFRSHDFVFSEQSIHGDAK